MSIISLKSYLHLIFRSTQVVRFANIEQVNYRGAPQKDKTSAHLSFGKNFSVTLETLGAVSQKCSTL